MRFMRVCSYRLGKCVELDRILPDSIRAILPESGELFTERLDGLEPFHFGRGEVAPLTRLQTAQGDGTHANSAQIANRKADGAAHFPDLAVPAFTNCNH